MNADKELILWKIKVKDEVGDLQTFFAPAFEAEEITKQVPDIEEITEATADEGYAYQNGFREGTQYGYQEGMKVTLASPSDLSEADNAEGMTLG
jgi:flagellar biosynthesis/type III secretory pathway protein FliH